MKQAKEKEEDNLVYNECLYCGAKLDRYSYFCNKKCEETLERELLSNKQEGVNETD